MNNLQKRTVQITTALLCFLMFCTSTLFAASDNYIGTGMENKRLAVHSPTFTGVSTSDQAALTDLVAIVRMNLHDYAGFSIIDAQNMEHIEELQAESEDGKYDLNSSIRAGKLKFAEYEAFITVSKSGSTYSLKLSITNLETGVVFAEAMVNKIQKVSDIEDSAVKNLTATIVPKMGIQLTAMGKYSLNGENTTNLTTEQEYDFVTQEVTSLQSSLNDFDQKLKQYTGSSDQLDQNAKVIKAEIETQRQLTEQRLLMAQQKAARLEEQRQKEQEEMIAAANRSQAANEKIRQISNDVESAASKIRTQEFISMNFAEQINMIEKEKKAYLELQEKIEREIKKLQTEMEEEYQKQWKDPDDLRNYEKIEIDQTTGRPYQAPRNLLIADNNQLHNKLLDELNQNIDKIRKNADVQLTEIRNDIAEKEKDLAEPQTANSLTMPELFSVGSFDMNTDNWIATVQLTMNGHSYFSEAMEIPFDKLCTIIDGKSFSSNDKNGNNGRALYTEYRDTAAAYESMFRMGTPFVYLEADYYVTTKGIDTPSAYLLVVSKLRLYYTNGKQLILSYRPNETARSIQMEPAYDIRTDKEKQAYETRLVKQRMQEQKELEQKERKIALQRELIGQDEILDAYVKNNLGLGVCYFSVTNSLGIRFYYDLRFFGHTYIDCDIAFGGNDANDYEGHALLGFGLANFHFLRDLALSPAFDYISGIWDYLPKNGPTDFFYQFEFGASGCGDAFGPCYGVGIGVDIPLTISGVTVMGINVKYDLLRTAGFGFTDALSIGFGMFLP